MYRQHKFAAALIATGLSGCGLSVPEIGELWDQDRLADPAHGTPTLTATAQIEYEIKQKVYCELSYAVEQVENIRAGRNGRPAIPYDWGVQMQLSLEVDESVSLSPGVTFTQLLPGVMKIFGVFPNNSLNSVGVAQSFSLGFGGTVSSEAHRIDKFNTYYSIKDLLQQATRHTGPCQIDGKPDPKQDVFISTDWTPAVSSPLLIQSDLALKNWLVGATFFDTVLPSTSPQPSGGGKFTSSGGDSGFKQDSFSQEIKFIIISSGNVTPTWKLIQLSANTNAPFFGTSRTRTHDLLITIGPPTTRTQNDFLASQIGQAVRSAVVVP
jgi:hypothetical protein